MTSPILREVPLQFETDRLLVRCPQPGDGPTVHASMIASLSALREFPASSPWAMSKPSLDFAEEFCRVGLANYLLRTYMPVLLFLKGTGTHVGCCDLSHIEWSVPKCEIGYWRHSDFGQQGFMAEAVKAFTDFAFTYLGMHRIEAFPDEENQASWMVCERAGYQLEGRLRNERKEPNGTMRNTRVYSIVR